MDEGGRRHIESREVVDDEQLRLTTVVVLQPLPEARRATRGASAHRRRVGAATRGHRTDRRRGPGGDDPVRDPAARFDLSRRGRRGTRDFPTPTVPVTTTARRSRPVLDDPFHERAAPDQRQFLHTASLNDIAGE